MKSSNVKKWLLMIIIFWGIMMLISLFLIECDYYPNNMNDIWSENKFNKKEKI